MYNREISRFKNIHSKASGIIFGTGPSLLEYNSDTSLHRGSIRVGVNSIIYHDVDLELDYFFVQDTGINEKHPNSYFKSKKIYDNYSVVKQKFYGISDGVSSDNWYLSLQDCEDGSAVPYQVNTSTYYKYTTSVDTEPLGNGHTVVMSAIQFLIYSGIERIYLVGVDCGGNRIKETSTKNYNLTGWEKMKEWVDSIPSVSIININPVGLIDIFDKY